MNTNYSHIIFTMQTGKYQGRVMDTDDSRHPIYHANRLVLMDTDDRSHPICPANRLVLIDTDDRSHPIYHANRLVPTIHHGY